MINTESIKEWFCGDEVSLQFDVQSNSGNRIPVSNLTGKIIDPHGYTINIAPSSKWKEENGSGEIILSKMMTGLPGEYNVILCFDFPDKSSKTQNFTYLVKSKQPKIENNWNLLELDIDNYDSEIQKNNFEYKWVTKEELVQHGIDLLKAKVAYHEHDGWIEHPVAVRNHQEYLSESKIAGSIKEDAYKESSEKDEQQNNITLADIEMKPKDKEKLDLELKQVFTDRFSVDAFRKAFSTTVSDFTTRINAIENDVNIIGGKEIPSCIVRTSILTKEDDKEVGFLVRNFRKEDGKIMVYHNTFEIKPVFRDNGLASNINENAEKIYKQIGVETIYLEANDSVGGYAWSKSGFDFQDSGELQDIKGLFELNIDNDIKKGLIDKRARQSLIADIDSMSHSWEFAGWNPLKAEWGKHLGKKYMLNSTWFGKKDLADSSLSYRIGQLYYEEKRKQLTETK